MATPDESDALYALPLEEFTAARNALAKELARQGDKAASASVKKLPKPSRTAWALNQLARRQGDDVAALLAAGDRLRDAQERALAGDASGLRAANREEQEKVDRLVEAAVALGVADGPARDRLRNTLRAAALDPSVGDVLRRGRLVSDVEAAGFGLEGLDGLVPAERTDAAGRLGEPDTADDGPSPAARREADRLDKEAEIARDRAERLLEDASRARHRAEAARREAEAAAAAAEDAYVRAEKAQQRADEARRRADEAAQALKLPRR